MFIHNINPVILQIGQLQIRYYGLFMALSVLFGIFFISREYKRLNPEVNEEELYNALFIMVLFGLLGARLDHILLHNPQFYINNPIEIIAIWHGGLAAHGAFLGGFLGLWLYSKKRKLKFWQIADLAVIPLSLGLALGRIANFINGELYGRITSVPWAVKFAEAEGFRHPSQLYESITDFATFIILNLIFKLKIRRKDGSIFWSFMLIYSAFRFFVEFFREPDYVIFGLTLGQFTSIIIIIISIPMLFKLSKTKNEIKSRRRKK
ncbi:MAG: prolipoprotein diacylglyceryl transferase [Candidatus Woesearchaeota archaeon]